MVGIESPGVEHSKQGTCPDEECIVIILLTRSFHCDSAHLQIIYKSQVVEVYHSIFQLPLTFTVIDTSMPLSRQSLASPVTNLQVDM